MKCSFKWRLVSPDGQSVTEMFDDYDTLHNAEKQNPDWKRQRVAVYQ